MLATPNAKASESLGVAIIILHRRDGAAPARGSLQQLQILPSLLCLLEPQFNVVVQLVSRLQILIEDI